MDKSAEMVGRLVVVLLFGCLALYFLVRGLAPGPRSRRLANLALFCSLSVFVMPEMVAGGAGLFRASGAARIVLGGVGIALAVAALVARRDGGVGVARPITGAGFSLLHLVVGAGLFLFGSFTAPSEGWAYDSPDGAFRLTLPSGRWKKAPSTGGRGIVAFVRPLPRMQASVLSVRQQQTEADFRRAIEAFRAQVEGNTQKQGEASQREGTNAAGNRYSYTTITERIPDGREVFVAHSLTWCPDRRLIVEVIFEGVPSMASQAGKAAEREAIEADAEALCLSVE